MVLHTAAVRSPRSLRISLECKVVLTGTGQWGGACQPGEGQEQQPWPGERHGGKPSCQPIVFPIRQNHSSQLAVSSSPVLCVVLTNLVEVAPDAPLPILAEV